MLFHLLLQSLLDHDNHELRKRMKDFFEADDIYIPRCAAQLSAFRAWACARCAC